MYYLQNSVLVLGILTEKFQFFAKGAFGFCFCLHIKHVRRKLLVQ